MSIMSSTFPSSVEILSESSDVVISNLLGTLMLPPQTREDVGKLQLEHPSNLSGSSFCAKFVADESDGEALVALLDRSTFLNFAHSVQSRVLALVEERLRGGLYSVIRFRLSCERRNASDWNTCTSMLSERLMSLLHHFSGVVDYQNHDKETIMDRLGKIMGMVLSAAVEVCELKALLKGLHEPSALTSPLLTAMKLMTDEEHNMEVEKGRFLSGAAVKHMFCFGGEGSGLALPRMMWPFPHEYQMCFLLRVEIFPGLCGSTSTQQKPAQAHLVTLLTEDGAGIDVVLEGSRLCFIAASYSRRKIESKITELDGVKLVQERWHALVFLHKQRRGMDPFGRDQLEVYLDEELVFSGGVNFPRNVVEPLTHCCLGCNLDGQMSGILLFSKAASLETAHSALRKMTAGNLDTDRGSESSTVLTPDLNMNPQSRQSTPTRLKKSLLSSGHKLLAAYLPSRARDGVCLEIHTGLHAKMRRKTHVWIVRKAKDVLNSVGGMGVLLLLGQRLISAKDNSLGSGLQRNFSGKKDLDLSAFLGLLSSFIVNHKANQRHMQSLGGVEIIEHLLHSHSGRLLAGEGAGTVMAVEQFCLAFGQSGEQNRLLRCSEQKMSTVFREDVTRPSYTLMEVFVDLFSNPLVWVQVQPELQFGLAERLLDVVRDNPRQFVGVLDVGAIIAGIKSFYCDQLGFTSRKDASQEWVGAGEDGMEKPRCSINSPLDESGKGWGKMTAKEQRHIRGCLWGAIWHILKEEAQEGDVLALIHFMTTCDDQMLVFEIVQLLSSLMRQKIPPHGLFKALESTPLQYYAPERSLASSSYQILPNHAGFLKCILQLCMNRSNFHDELCAGGIRCVSVFMARVGYRGGLITGANVPRATVATHLIRGVTAVVTSTAGESSSYMERLASYTCMALTERLVECRHILGRATCAALLEMTLLDDESKVPWVEQMFMVNVVNGCTTTRDNVDGSKSSQDTEGPDDIFWNWDAERAIESSGIDEADTNKGRDRVHVLDGSQDIRNIPPLVLLLQLLPAMSKTVQMHFCENLLLMLIVTEENCHRVVSTCSSDGGVFWGSWQCSIFLIMAPIFARLEQKVLSRSTGKYRDSPDAKHEGKGMVDQSNLLVVRLYTTLLLHAVETSEEGYKEIELAASLHRMTPHGRGAVNILLAQLAVLLQKRLALLEVGKESRIVLQLTQPVWNNVVHLAFIAAHLVTEDVSTALFGLFSGSDDVNCQFAPGRKELNENASEYMFCVDDIPAPMCACTTEESQISLAGQVLRIFGALSSVNTELGFGILTTPSKLPDQGMLIFALLRLCLFLLVKLHPCSSAAKENVSHLKMLVFSLVSTGTLENGSNANAVDSKSKHVQEKQNWCFVVLVHVQSLVCRLLVLVQKRAGTILVKDGVSTDDECSCEALHRQHLPPKVADVSENIEAKHAHAVGVILHDILCILAEHKLDLLSMRLGQRLTGALVDVTTAAKPTEANMEWGGLQSWKSPFLGRELGDDDTSWQSVLQSLQWVCESELFFSASLRSTGADVHNLPKFVDVCMSTLKAADMQESCAVSAVNKLLKQLWQKYLRHTSISRTGDWIADDQIVGRALESLEQQAVRSQALRKIKQSWRMATAQHRWEYCVKTFSAAWSPFAEHVDGDANMMCRWKISSYKDRYMRQMLLEANDEFIDYSNASYDFRAEADNSPLDGTSSTSGPGSKLLPSVFTGEVGLVDVVIEDDTEQVDGLDTGDGRQDTPYKTDADNTGAAEISLPPGWEDLALSIAVDGGAEISPYSLRGTQEWAVAAGALGLGLSTMPHGGLSGSLQGKWCVTMVLQQCLLQGILTLTNCVLFFHATEEPREFSQSSSSNPRLPAQLSKGYSKCWRLDRLTEIHLRRFLLSPQAVEIFWADSYEVFLAFEGVLNHQQFIRQLRKQKLPMLPSSSKTGSLNARQVLRASKLTETWRRRQMSNFEYIMQLNTIAGRSYNDITQYPVFPWVLADYSSTELDLNNPDSFRDLSKPVGALDEKMRAKFLERYATFDDPEVPKFMYGSHYSNAGIVLHYLMRQEPFTTMHINLQGGRFDCPDRLFNDLCQCWEGCAKSNSTSDVKELTPEFFCCPEIFLNSNALPLGEMQSDQVAVGDVRLPPWAKDAYDFVRLHRKALESEQVSQHLHEWVDLIFGYKQRGPEAVKAANVFYYLTYEGAVDLTQVNDPLRKEVMEAQINHYGQTPSQLLMEPHPVRLPLEECVQSLFSPECNLNNLRVYSPQNWPKRGNDGPALLVRCTEDKLVCIHASLRVTTCVWSNIPDGTGLPFTLLHPRTRSLPSHNLHIAKVLNQSMSTKGLVTMSSLKLGQMPVASSVGGVQSHSSITDAGNMLNSFWGQGTQVDDAHGSSLDMNVSMKTTMTQSIEAHSCFDICPAFGSNPAFILSCGYWDETVKCHVLDSALQLPLVGTGNGGHLGAVTCLCMAESGTLLVTGGEDATCRVWVVGNSAVAAALTEGNIDVYGTSTGGELHCVHILWGHEAAVSCLVLSEELGLALSGARDGRIVVHSLQGGRFLRQFHCAPDPTCPPTASKASIVAEASQVALSCHGNIVVHSWTDLSLNLFSLNGAHRARAKSSTVQKCMLTVGGGELLVMGDQRGILTVSTLHNLCAVRTIDIQGHGEIACMRLSPDHQYLLVGSEDGEVSIITDARTRLHMLDLALKKAFVS
ncbi:unnamed protein product [Choristocarpus tenellus]